ncbi:Uncharacterised protein [Streptococcus pneumoniae]|nr:Uncharacterised protein [Streptococcus pneumoniae]
MLDCVLLGLILEEDFVSIIYYFKFILYKIYSLRREKSKYLIYTAYIIFGVNVVYGIQWLLKELISTISP